MGVSFSYQLITNSHANILIFRILNIYCENKIGFQHTDLLVNRAWTRSMRFILDPHSSNAEVTIVLFNEEVKTFNRDQMSLNLCLCNIVSLLLI